ncbi:hypothetical protein AGMMS49546_28140 [Spirochaetia bacterium]|nr:hypothetical protein AGMMS49546_28140 [Spirochaetia bacterium]
MGDFWNAQVSSNGFHFIIPVEYRTSDWSENFGIIQEAIKQGNLNSQDFNSISVDMQNCSWIDPIPMLSLLISLIEFKTEVGNCTIHFSDKNIKNVLSFLKQEGFLEILIKGNINISIGENIFSKSEDAMSYINKLPTELEYNNSFVLPARIIDLQSYSEEKINRLILDFTEKEIEIKEKVPAKTHDMIFMKLYHILFETIDNVFRHAYPNSSKHKYVGVYIRYRYGNQKLSNISKSEKIKIMRLAEKEKISHPQLSTSMIENNDGFFEVFVIDSGMGLVGSIGKEIEIEIEKGYRKKYHSPFLGCFQAVFFNRKRKQQKRFRPETPHGGLDHIARIMRSGNDYIYAHEGKDWIGFHSTLNPIDISKNHSIDKSNVMTVNGLSWVFRLSWEITNVRNINDINYFKGVPSSHPVYLALTNRVNTNFEFDDAFIIDQRKRFSDIKNKPISGNSYPSKTFFWLPDSTYNKNDILKRLIYYVMCYKLTYYLSNEKIRVSFYEYIDKKDEEYDWLILDIRSSGSTIDDYVKYLLNPQIDDRNRKGAVDLIEKRICNVQEKINQNGCTLVILDVPSYEIIIYKNSLNNIRTNNGDLSLFFSMFENIIVCSKTYEIIAFSVSQGKLNREPKLETDFFDITSANINMSKCALYLRRNDSSLFWHILSTKHDKEQYFLNANIIWEKGRFEKDQCKKDLVITGYLYFDSIVNNYNLYLLLYNSIERIIGLFSTRNAHFVGSDIIVQQIVNELNVQYYNELTDNQVNVNSVYVTGKTSSSLLSVNNKNNNLTINFFRNKTGGNSSIDGEQCELLLWPKQDWINEIDSGKKTRFPFNDKIYKRIGSTHLINYGNNEPHIIDRNDKSFEKVYERGIIKTYEDIQKKGTGIIRLGHYHYENFHMLFNIKYNTIFENSIRTKDGVFMYLFKTIFFLLANSFPFNKNDKGFWINNLSDEIKENIKETHEKKYSDWGSVSIIIYPSHHYSALIMRQIINDLPKQFIDRIIPLHVFASNNGHISNITPNLMKTIENKLISLDNEKRNYGNKIEDHDILFFDTLIESGRTRKSIKHILLSSAFKVNMFKTLSIVDSQKLLYKAPDSDRHHAYWRLDIPRLGDRHTCKLCLALSLLNDIKREVSLADKQLVSNFMTTEEIKNRLLEWGKSWKYITALDQMGAHAISPSPIATFPSESIDSEFAPTLRTNIGLAVYATELQCIHIRDNILLDILEKISKDDYELVTLLLSCRFLLFGDYSSKSFHIEMLKKMILAISHISDANNYSALGVLVLLSQDKENVKNALLSLLIDSYELNLFNDEHNNVNSDLKILLAYLSQSMEQLYCLLPSIIVNSFDNIKIREAYIDFHYGLYNDNGDTHTNDLEKYVVYKDPKYLPQVAIVIQFILEKLRFILQSREIEKINIKIQNLSKKIYQYLSSETLVNKSNNIILKNTIDVYESLMKIHSMYFLRLSTKNDPDTFLEKISSIINENNRKHTIELSPEKKAIIVSDYVASLPKNKQRNLWCFWNSDIESEFNYLLDNSKHCCGLIKTKFDEFVHMCVRIEYTESHCVINLRNLSLITNVDYEKETRQKWRLSMTRIKKLGVEIIPTLDDHKADAKEYIAFDNSKKYYFLNIAYRIPRLNYDERMVGK